MHPVLTKRQEHLESCYVRDYSETYRNKLLKIKASPFKKKKGKNVNRISDRHRKRITRKNQNIRRKD